jgi:hypothetical protein
MADGSEHGFPFEYCSDVDGVRFLVIDPRDADMSGWRLLLGFNPSFWKEPVRDPDEWDDRFQIVEFTRDQRFYRTAANRWNALGFGEPEYPWSACVDHGETISRWIPPDGKPGD